MCAFFFFFKLENHSRSVCASGARDSSLQLVQQTLGNSTRGHGQNRPNSCESDSAEEGTLRTSEASQDRRAQCLWLPCYTYFSSEHLLRNEDTQGTMVSSVRDAGACRSTRNSNVSSIQKKKRMLTQVKVKFPNSPSFLCHGHAYCKDFMR